MVDNIYQLIGDKVYKMIKPTSLTKFNMPREIIQLSTLEADATAIIDAGNKSLGFYININTLANNPVVKDNSVRYNELSEFIKTNKIEKAESIGYNFKIIIDYSIFDDDNKEVRSVVVRSVDGVDCANLIPNTTNNTISYQRVKRLDTKFNFYTGSNFRHGIISSNAEQFIVKINKVAIYQNLTNLPDSHESNYNVPLSADSQAVTYLLTNHVKIYESTVNTRFNEIRTTMAPNKLAIAVTVITGGYVDVFNDTEFSKNFTKKEG